jgi:hypothetical protein
LNKETPKDEYPMPVAEMLVDSAEGFEYLSMLDSYSGYNQIFIAEEDVSKTTFRSLEAPGTYEWVVIPFGLKNVGATNQRAMNSMFHDRNTNVQNLPREQPHGMSTSMIENVHNSASAFAHQANPFTIHNAHSPSSSSIFG